MKNISDKSHLTALLTSAILMGCVAQTPHLDSSFGEAVNSAKALQTINPDASLEVDTKTGVGGMSADAAIDRYHKSYESPTVNTNVFSIGVGGNSDD